jgi:hypothetical protein
MWAQGKAERKGCNFAVLPREQSRSARPQPGVVTTSGHSRISLIIPNGSVLDLVHRFELNAIKARSPYFTFTVPKKG